MRPGRMRVLELQGAVGWGGSERHTLMLAVGLARSSDCDVTVVGPYDRNPRLLDALVAAGIPCPPIELGRKLVAPLSLWRLARLIRRERIDVVHTHLRNADILGIVAGWLTHTPVVTTLHGLTGPLDGPGDRMRRLMRRLHASLLRRGVQRVIAVSRFAAEANVRALGLPADRVLVVHNGSAPGGDAAVDHGAQRAALGVGPEAPIVAFFGGFSRQKGIDHFAAVAARVGAACPDAHFLAAGAGPLEPAIRTQVRRDGLDGRFHLLGWRADVPELLAITSVAVVPARDEGFGRIATEAMAAGKPVVAFASGALPEIVVDGETGYLLPYGNRNAMAARVIELIGEPERCRRLGARGRERVGVHFSPALFVERTRALLRGALGS